MNDNNKSSGSSGGIFWTLLAVAFIVLAQDPPRRG